MERQQPADRVRAEVLSSTEGVRQHLLRDTEQDLRGQRTDSLHLFRRLQTGLHERDLLRTEQL